MWLVRAERWLQLATEADDKADDEPLTPGTPPEIAGSPSAGGESQ